MIQIHLFIWQQAQSKIYLQVKEDGRAATLSTEDFFTR